MVSKLYDGSNWKNLNGLKLWNGSAWKNSVRGWMWDGTAWKQWYPEYPVNTTAPSVSGTATQGNTLSCTTGSWNSNLAYTPSSYSYQWRRGSSDISGATSSTYATVVADVGSDVSCRVTATNNRGPTPVVSSNSITVTSALPGAPSGLTVTSSTTTPGTFTVSGSSTSATPTITMGSNSGVTSTAGTINWSSSNQSSYSSSGTFSGTGSTATSISKSGLSASTNYTGTVTITGPGATTASGSWTAATNTSSYSVSTSAATLSSNTTNRTWSLSSGTTGGSYTITVTATNTSGSALISWNAGSNATSYDIYINGTYWTNTASTSATYNWGQTGNLSVNVRSRNSTGAETTGVSGNGAVSSATRQAQSSGTFASAQTASANYSLTTSAPPAVAPSTPTNGGGTYQDPSFSNNFNFITNATFTSSSSGTTPITYSWSVRSSDFANGPWALRNSGSINSSNLSSTISIPQQGWDSDSFGAAAQYTVSATNDGGTSGSLVWTLVSSFGGGGGEI